jgi:hypothetical protein
MTDRLKRMRRADALRAEAFQRIGRRSGERLSAQAEALFRRPRHRSDQERTLRFNRVQRELGA